MCVARRQPNDCASDFITRRCCYSGFLFYVSLMTLRMECIFGNSKIKAILSAAKICYCRETNKNTWLLVWGRNLIIIYSFIWSTILLIRFLHVATKQNNIQQLIKFNFKQIFSNLKGSKYGAMQNGTQFIRKHQYKVSRFFFSFGCHCYPRRLFFLLRFCKMCASVFLSLFFLPSFLLASYDFFHICLE